MIERLYFIERHLLKMHESNYHVRDLDTGVIDIVLHFDAIAEGLENSHEAVTQNRIPHVADVRRLVGIDAGVLDHELAI